MKTIPIDLVTLRNLIFDVGGLDREFVNQSYLSSKGLTAEKICDILLIDKDKEFFYYDSITILLWQPRAWKASAERHYKERERNAKDVSRHELRKEALKIFANGLYKITPSMNREERVAIGEMLLRKRNFIKFASISGLDISEDKWKGLIE